jgi:ParB-like nuclease domain
VTMPILVDEDGEIIAGHGRVMAAEKLGYAELPVLVARGWSDEEKKAYRIADNRLSELSSWDTALLAAELSDLGAADFDLSLVGYSTDDLANMMGTGAKADGAGSLADRFLIPPFSVLNAREGWWQDRKRAWLALGIQSELGRGENALGFSDTILEPDPAKRKTKRAA